MRNKGQGVYETVSPIRPGTSFKMEIKNSTECYIYVFGKETDGTSYTLFPYPKADDPGKSKYSPFCGITGYRLFPKDKSMTADSIGTRDVIGVVISKEPLDWNSVNSELSRNPQQDFRQRLFSVVKASAANQQATGNGNMQLRAASSSSTILACTVEIAKQ